MGSCEYYREQVELELDGELSAQERTELNKHILICPDCRRYYGEAKALWSALAELEMDPPGDIAGPVMARLARRKTWRLAGIAAIIVIAGVSTFPVLIQAATWALTSFLDLDLHWVPKLLSTIWQTARVLYKGWTLLSEALPDQYWLGLAALAAIDLAMLVKLFGNKLAQGGSTG